MRNCPCRELYSDLVKQCQTMHSSVGTGSLAYVVGSKVMDMRTSSKDERQVQAKLERATSSDSNVKVGECCDNRNVICAEVANAGHHESYGDWVDLVSLRASTDHATYEYSGQENCSSPKLGREPNGPHSATDNSFDFPPLPVTNLFEKGGEDKKLGVEHDDKLSARSKLRFEGERMHSFQINNNVDLVIESNGESATFHPTSSEIEIASPDEDEPKLSTGNPVYEVQMANQLDVPQPAISASMSQGWPSGEDRAAEWLWTLHRIGI